MKEGSAVIKLFMDEMLWVGTFIEITKDLVFIEAAVVCVFDSQCVTW
jgi:hypothetical protein